MNLEKTIANLQDRGGGTPSAFVDELNAAINEHSLKLVKENIKRVMGTCPLITKMTDGRYMFKKYTYKVSIDFEEQVIFNTQGLLDTYDTHNGLSLLLSPDHPVVAGGYLYKWVKYGEECEECGVAFLSSYGEHVCPTCQSKNKPMPYSTRAEDLLGMETTKETLFGIELEYENVTAKQVNACLKGHAIAKSDGSITKGVEVVTRPACIKTHKEKLSAFYSAVKTKAYPNTGMHVHVEKKKLSNYMIGFMMEFLNHKDLIPHVEKVAGRDYSSNTYCKAKENVKMTWGNTFSEESYKLKRTKTEKYSPLNTAKDHTIEIRIFSSPESHQEACAKLDFVNALVKYSSPYSISVKRLQDKFSWPIFIAYIESNKKEFPDFVAHFIKKEIV